MTRGRANSIVKEILAKYAGDVPSAPVGRRSDLYDLERVKPLDFYVDLYRQRKEEIGKLGIDYSVAGLAETIRPMRVTDTPSMLEGTRAAGGAVNKSS